MYFCMGCSSFQKKDKGETTCVVKVVTVSESESHRAHHPAKGKAPMCDIYSTY